MTQTTRYAARFGLLVVVTACLLALVGCAAGERTVVVPEGGAAPTITVNATSEVKVVPDKAQIGVAVTTQAQTAAETQEQNAAGINAVIDALKALGIDEKSIQTTYTYLNPRYDYASPLYYGAAGPEEGVSGESEEILAEGPEIAADSASSTNIVGYEMTTNLSVKDLNIDQVSEVLQACVAAGANNTDGIQYYSSEYDAKYAEALAAAVEAARAKAEVLANASGVKLGSVYSVTEGYQNMAVRYDTGMAMEADDSAMKVMPGEVDVSASVTVAYEVA